MNKIDNGPLTDEDVADWFKENQIMAEHELNSDETLILLADETINGVEEPEIELTDQLEGQLDSSMTEFSLEKGLECVDYLSRLFGTECDNLTTDALTDRFNYIQIHYTKYS